MPPKAILLCAFLATLMGCSNAENDAAATAGSVDAGQALVEANCAACHATGREGDSPVPVAPPFRELHLRYDVEFLGEALVEGIVTAHEDMPQFVFEPEEADAIIRYLKSLEKPAS